MNQLAAPTNVPGAFQARGGAVSRRAVLGGLTSLAAMFALPPMASATPRRPSPSPAKPGQVGGAPGIGDTTTPYQVQASCELSEDYFLTEDVLVSPDDKLVPFINYDNGESVEAILLAAATNTVQHVRRDPTNPAGWTTAEVAVSLPNVADVAVAASAQGIWLMALALDRVSLSFTQLAASTWGTPSTQKQQTSLVGGIGGSVDPSGIPYFYGWGVEGLPSQKAVATYLYVWDARTPGTPRTVAEWSDPLRPTPPVVVNAIVSYDFSGGHGAAAVIFDNNSLVVSPQISPKGFPWPMIDVPAGTTYSDNAAELLWLQMAPDATNNITARVLWRENTTASRIIQSYEADVSYPLYACDDFDDGALTSWVVDGGYIFTMLDGGVATVVDVWVTEEQSDDGPLELDVSVGVPIPLLPGLTNIYSDPTDPTQATLFAVAADTSLAVLVKDPVRGWVQNQVHIDADPNNPTLQEVQSWRVQIDILDVNGVHVANAPAQISADRLVALWQPAGSTTIEPGTTVTLTTDFTGQLVVNIPAEELDCAILTVQALDAVGNPTGDPFVVSPHIDVQRFLAGQSSLPDIGTLTGPTMQSATTASGAPLFPGLSAAGAASAAAAISHIASIGLNATSAPAVQSAQFVLTGSAPTFHSSRNPRTYTVSEARLNAKRRRDARRRRGPGKRRGPIRGRVGGVSDWWGSAVKDAESAYHGLRKGAIKLKSATTNWDAQAKQWTLNLIVDIGDGLDNVLNYVITDVRSAIHAISGFFHALQADINDAIDWLKHHVLEVLKEALANADIIQGWLGEMSSTFTAQINKYESFVDNYFSGLAATVHGQIADLVTKVEDETFGGAVPLPPASTDSGSDMTDLLKDLKTVGKVFDFAPAQWLWHKIKHYLPSDSSGLPTISGADTVWQDLITDMGDAGELIADLGNLVYTTFKEAFISKDAFSATSFTEFFTLLDKVVDDALQLADHLADTVLDVIKLALSGFNDMLNYQFASVPFLTELLKKVGVNLDLTVGRLLALLGAFPATIINKALRDGPLFPSPEEIRSAADNSYDPWAIPIGLVSAGIQSFWAGVGMTEDIDAANPNASTPVWAQILDVLAPAALAILQWPTEPLTGKKTAPPASSTRTSGEDSDYIGWMIALTLAPFCVGAFVSWYLFDKEKNDDDILGSGATAVTQCLCGIPLIVLTSLWNWDNDQGIYPKITGIAGGISYVFAPLGFQEVGAATSGGSYVIKFIADTAANFTTAYAFGAEGVDAMG